MSVFPCLFGSRFVVVFLDLYFGGSDKGLDIYVILQPSDQDKFNRSAFMRPVGVIKQQVSRVNQRMVRCAGEGGRGSERSLCVADTVWKGSLLRRIGSLSFAASHFSFTPSVEKSESGTQKLLSQISLWHPVLNVPSVSELKISSPFLLFWFHSPRFVNTGKEKQPEGPLV